MFQDLLGKKDVQITADPAIQREIQAASSTTDRRRCEILRPIWAAMSDAVHPQQTFARALPIPQGETAPTAGAVAGVLPKVIASMTSCVPVL